MNKLQDKSPRELGSITEWGTRYLSLLQSVAECFGAHRNSYLLCAVVLFAGGKAAAKSSRPLIPPVVMRLRMWFTPACFHAVHRGDWFYLWTVEILYHWSFSVLMCKLSLTLQSVLFPWSFQLECYKPLYCPPFSVQLIILHPNKIIWRIKIVGVLFAVSVLLLLWIRSFSAPRIHLSVRRSMLRPHTGSVEFVASIF